VLTINPNPAVYGNISPYFRRAVCEPQTVTAEWDLNGTLVRQFGVYTGQSAVDSGTAMTFCRT
jgi:hypothetical protein